MLIRPAEKGSIRIFIDKLKAWKVNFTSIKKNNTVIIGNFRDAWKNMPIFIFTPHLNVHPKDSYGVVDNLPHWQW